MRLVVPWAMHATETNNNRDQQRICFIYALLKKTTIHPVG
jgi:hypothetical protein